VFTGPIAYTGREALRADLANFKAASAKVKAEEGFITSVAPGSFARRQNRYYTSDEAFLQALGEAMREEYRAVIEAGFVLQLDDPGLPDTWDMANPEPSVEEYKKFATVRVEALNHALRGLPEDRIRYHICWGSWHGPHTTDLPLGSIVDVLLQVHAGAFSVEAGNVRHAHEWKVWQDVKLPDGKILIPGVVSHATNVVEHPELVADRILTFARVVARTSSPAPIAASAAAFIRKSPGPSSRPLSRARGSRPRSCGLLSLRGESEASESADRLSAKPSQAPCTSSGRHSRGVCWLDEQGREESCRPSLLVPSAPHFPSLHRSLRGTWPEVASF
jgi:hypothetical protein